MAVRSMAERLLDILELLAGHPDGAPLTNLARDLDIPKSATFRILSVLVGRGFVERPGERETYRLSMKLPSLGFRFVEGLRVVDVCQPVLDRLAAETGELVRMTLADDKGLTWIAKAQGARLGLRYDPDMGLPVVLHATASGRAWLSAMPEDAALRLVEAKGYAVPERFAARKIGGGDALLAELRHTRDRGFGLAIDEGEAGTSAVAVALPSPGRAPSPGTVSIAGPISRLSKPAIAKILPALRSAARELGELWPIVRGGMRS